MERTRANVKPQKRYPWQCCDNCIHPITINHRHCCSLNRKRITGQCWCEKYKADCWDMAGEE